MKIAILFLTSFGYVVYSSDENDGEAAIKHGIHYNYRNPGYVPFIPIQTYRAVNIVPRQPVVQPRPVVVRQPVVQPRRSSISRNALILWVFSMFMKPTATTAASVTTVAPATAAPTTTTTTTEGPLADWTQVGDCYYIFPSTTATWMDASITCAALTDRGRLAVVGFNAVADDRADLLSALSATSETFWIGALGSANVPPGAVSDHQFTSPLEDLDPTNLFPATPDLDFVSEIDDGDVVNDQVICGRVNDQNPNLLTYEGCRDGVHRYMCEYCE